jgi:AraC family transcriptional regulator
MLSLFSPDLQPFTAAQTHGILLRPEQTIIANSDRLGWRALYASTQRETAYQDDYRGLDDHLLIVHLDGPVEVFRMLSGDNERRVVPPGGLFLMPARRDFGVRLEGELSSVHIYLRGRALHAVAEEVFGDLADRVDLLPRLGERDELVEAIARSLKDCIEATHASDRLMAEALGATLAVHLLRRHSNLSDTTPLPSPGALAPAKLAKVHQFVEAHLEDPVSVPEMAAAAGLSPIHFARAFRAATGKPPHQYLLEARVRRARKALERGESTIAEIAFACGFSHQEHLTRVFKKALGVTPGAYRRVFIG